MKYITPEMDIYEVESGDIATVDLDLITSSSYSNGVNEDYIGDGDSFFGD